MNDRTRTASVYVGIQNFGRLAASTRRRDACHRHPSDPDVQRSGFRPRPRGPEGVSPPPLLGRLTFDRLFFSAVSSEDPSQAVVPLMARVFIEVTVEPPHRHLDGP